MSKTVVANLNINLSGDGEVGNYVGANPANTNAPDSVAIPLGAGNNTVSFPSGFTYTSLALLALPTSANAKTVKGIAGDSGLSGWTNGLVVIPATPGGSCVIAGAGYVRVVLHCGSYVPGPAGRARPVRREDVPRPGPVSCRAGSRHA